MSLEHNLRKSGKLNSLADLKDFWNAMLFSPTPTATPIATPTKENTPPLPPQVWEEEEEEDYSPSWAITALPPEHYGKVVDMVELWLGSATVLSSASTHKQSQFKQNKTDQR